MGTRWESRAVLSFDLRIADRPDASPVPRPFDLDCRLRTEPTVDEQPGPLTWQLGPAPMATSGIAPRKDVCDKAKNLGHRTPTP